MPPDHDRSFRQLPSSVHTLVVGSGPSALYLSFLLNGNVPYYDPDTNGPHPDRLLHTKLDASKDQPLYDTLDDLPALTAHFGSSISYSSTAHKANVLMDALSQPNVDIDFDPAATRTRVRYQHHPGYKTGHVVIGCSALPGGQWSEVLDGCEEKGDDAHTLSYAETLSLPGYSFRQFYKMHIGAEMPPFTRPRRTDVARYYSMYPQKVGIEDNVFSRLTVTNIVRDDGDGFLVSVQCGEEDVDLIRCQHIVLASGLFSHPCPPPDTVAPYVDTVADRPRGRTLYDSAILSEPASASYRPADESLPDTSSDSGVALSLPPTPTLPSLPVLVIGSGFSAADYITTLPLNRPLIHMFYWDPVNRPSPLKACHPEAYPEYSRLYQSMKAGHGNCRSAGPYEGIANGEVLFVKEVNEGLECTIRLQNGQHTTRLVEAIKPFTGRRTKMNWLSPSLRYEMGVIDPKGWVGRDGFKQEILEKGWELANGVWVCGALAGDSLVRYGLGGVISVAKELTKHPEGHIQGILNGV
ncbi:hypothetical protein YB2330_004307 [Saitoella coloradoensis]